MINTEHLIKKKAVSHDAYNQDSDEELFMQMDMGQQGRGGRRKNGNNGYGSNRRRKKRHHDPKFYANDSDFDSSSDNDDEKKLPDKKQIYIGNKMNNNNNGLHQTFHKVNVQPTMPNQQKSALSRKIDGWSNFPSVDGGGRAHAGNGGGRGHANGHGRNGHNGYGRAHAKNNQRGRPGQGRNGHHNQNGGGRGGPTQNQSRMMNGRYEPESEHANGGLFASFILTVYFGEYLQEEPIRFEITTPMTVHDTMNKAIQQWKVERPIAKLKGTMASHYTMRTMDIDEVSVEIDDDIPAFGKGLKIHTLGAKIVGLQFIGRGASNSVGYESGPSSMDKQSSVGIMQFKNAKEQILVRVSIPGPNNESHVLAIDKDATALYLKDVIALLNKKKHKAHFHAQYFNFYMNHGQDIKLKDPLNLTQSIIELDEPRQLMLLPKFLTKKDDESEAFNFNLVRLANEVREYHCTKIRNARKNKKRLLIVNKQQIIKKAMDDYNIGTNDHVPIDIVKIIDIHVNDKNNKQFSIEYQKPQAGGARLQVYELESAKECSEFVAKVKYLRTLRRLQGLP